VIPEVISVSQGFARSVLKRRNIARDRQHSRKQALTHYLFSG